jgi:hypothetical protein
MDNFGGNKDFQGQFFGNRTGNEIQRETKDSSPGRRPSREQPVSNYESLPGRSSTEQKDLNVSKVNFVSGNRNSEARRSPQSRPSHINQKSNGEISHAQRVILEAIKGEYSYGKRGQILGISSMIGGVILGLHGVAGSTSWTARLLVLESQINDAAPGVVLFIVGLFMVWATKPKINLKDLKG